MEGSHAHSGFKTHTGGFMRTKDVKHGRGNSVSRVPAGYHTSVDESVVNQGEHDMTTTYNKSPGHPGGARFGGLINPVHGEQASTDTLPKLTGQVNQQSYNR